jgi:hypothetical protein
LLCDAFKVNGIWMGQTTRRENDTLEFGQSNPAVRRLIKAGFRFAELAQTEREELQGLLRRMISSLRDTCPDPATTTAFGFKRPIMAFAVELILETYEDARVIHLVRDGRDVMLSRLGWRMSHLDNPLNRLTVFGDDHTQSYRGRPLTQQVVDEYRNELEMIHWVTSVSVAMRGRRFSERYLEIRYEDLCTDPVATLGSVFGFLDVPFRDEARRWIEQHASARAIGKWRGRESELASAISIGEPLLKELGYIGE